MNTNRLLSKLRPLLLFGALVLIGAVETHACTTFVLEASNHVCFGRNFDWFAEDALVVVNPRGVEKTALALPDSSPAKWVSKYGSLTFNSAGWELPTGGMNEVGLVVEEMVLGETHYPGPDARPALNPLQWVQYALDTCRSVNEVIAACRRIRVAPEGIPVPIHYLVCDAAGNCAAIEFLDGKMVCHRGKTLPYPVLANEPYDEAAAQARACLAEKAAGKALTGDIRRFGRFIQAAWKVAEFKPGTTRDDVNYAYQTLDEVCQGDFTVWRLVYDVTGRKIHYRTRNHPGERVLDLKKMDFAGHGPIRFFELDSPSGEGVQPKFSALSEASYRDYARRYLSEGWVRQQLGDMIPFMEAMAVNLRGYRYAESPGGDSAPLGPETAAPVSLSAEQILRKALEVRGGHEAAVRIRSYEAKGTMDLPWLKGSPFEEFALRPDKYRMTAEFRPSANFKGGRYDQGTDGQIAWEGQPGAPCKRLSGGRLEERLQGARFFAEIDEPEDCRSASCLGATTFEGRECYAVQLWKKSGEKTTHYFDAQSFQLAGSLGTATVGDSLAWVVMTYSDYRTFDGFSFPTLIHARSQRTDALLRINSIRANGVKSSVFHVPAEMK